MTSCFRPLLKQTLLYLKKEPFMSKLFCNEENDLITLLQPSKYEKNTDVG